MREILFRGKRIDNGEWAYGFFTQSPSGNAYITETVCGGASPKKVIPETVGQFTSLKDKNGNKIFEGDILQGDYYPFCNNGERNYFAEVIWFENSPAFGLYTFKNPVSKVRGISTGNVEYMEDFDSNDWEVIGNIHDNPELLR